jgi:hypothetical protein
MMSAMPTLLRTRRLPELLDEALDLSMTGGWSPYFWVAVPLALLSAAFSVVSLQWTGALAGGDLASLLSGCGGLALLLVLVPVSIVLSLIGYTALFRAAICRVAGETVSVSAMYRFAVQPRVLLTVAMAALSVFFATLLLVVPGLVVFLLLSMVVPVMSHEGLWGTAALTRSVRLTLERREKELRRFHLVRVLAVFVAYVGIGYSMSLIITLPYQLTTQVALWRQVAAGQTVDPSQALNGLLWLQVPTNVITSLVGSWVVFYACHCLALLYLDFRSRVWGIDLEAVIDSWSEPALRHPDEVQVDMPEAR